LRKNNKKTIKHPKDMTTDETIAYLFHPKGLKHLKKHMEQLSIKKRGNLVASIQSPNFFQVFQGEK